MGRINRQGPRSGNTGLVIISIYISKIMKGFKCAFTGEEVFTDGFKFEVYEDLLYKVHGKYQVENMGVDERAIGGNKSEEAGDEEGTDDNVLALDIVAANSLELPPDLESKGDYKRAVKGYLAKLAKKVKADKPDRVGLYKDKVQTLIVELLGEHDKVTIYYTKNDCLDKEGMPVIVDDALRSSGAKAGDTFKLYAWIDGLTEEKY